MIGFQATNFIFIIHYLTILCFSISIFIGKRKVRAQVGVKMVIGYYELIMDILKRKLLIYDD